MSEDPHSRGVVRVPILSEDVDALFQGKIGIVDNFPDDVTVTDFHFDVGRDTFYFILESEQFEPVKEGDKIPEGRIEIAQKQLQNINYEVTK